MRGASLAAGLVLSATIASADPVLISVGQLDDATRLVLTFQDRPDWTSETTGEGVAIQFAASGFEVNVEEGNRFISGTRIASIGLSDDGAALSLRLACDCAARTFEFGAGSLVIEVRDEPRLSLRGPVMSDAPAPMAPPTIADRVPTLQPPALLRRSGTKVRTLARPVPLAAPATSSSPQPRIWPRVSAATEIAQLPWLTANDPGRSQAVEFLGRELSRAAAQGLIEADEEDMLPRPSGNPAFATPGLEDRSNLSVITGLDRDVFAGRDARPPTFDGIVCFSDREVDLRSWGDATGLREIGAMRRAAVAENGDIDPGGALALARYYIALGFGSEAARAAAYLDNGKQKRLILALADIVDHGATDRSVLKGQLFCEGQVALWAALAGPIVPGDEPVSTDIILSTFSAFPSHIRAHLGPVLAERMRTAGLEDEARHVVNAIARGGGHTNESALATARLELGGTRPEEARETLRDLSTGTDLSAAEALLELLMDAERRGMPPNPDWVEEAPSLTRATDGTDVAANLNLAGLRGLIALGHFGKLRTALFEDTPGLSVETREQLGILGIAAAAASASDVDFLQAEIGLSRLFRIENMTQDQRHAVSNRLLEIGRATRAADYLIDAPATADEVDTAAEILVTTGQAREAEALLSAHPDESNRAKLGQILARSGSDDRAIPVLEATGQTDAAARAAIRAGRWDWIATREIPGRTGALSQATRSLLERPPEPEDPATPKNGDLIRASEDLRARVSNLLDETRLSDGAPAFTN